MSDIIGRARVLQVLAAPRVVFVVPSGVEGLADRLLSLGDDASGRALEVVAVVVDDGATLLLEGNDSDRLRHAMLRGSLAR